ncbi:putative bifunctional diguanylate cyclase/phosphodiesterase [Rhodoferax koreense]|uniref:putative bifunctional diguanylate cyclase/phosphodiesterase n=1 Tax=Rhodoferax koreensis TaxID=1842727 RepID=UPI001EF695F3|nr:EAL domain-containing protein [Rhodoferax koreense]
MLYLGSTYALPLAIGLISLLGLIIWSPVYAPADARPLAFKVVQETAAASDMDAVLAQLRGLGSLQHVDTRLSPAGFWMLFTVGPTKAGENTMVEFTSRHAVSLACWNAATKTPLGQANRETADGSLSIAKAGFALAVPVSARATEYLCRTSALGPARLSLVQWPAAQLQISEHEFHHNAGLLDGGLTVLALFVLITALINREGTYLLFATWLLLNLRVAALSAGWDSQWLGRSVPQNWLFEARAVSLALYYLVTVTLFKTLFKDDLARVGYNGLIRFAQWSCLPLLLGALVLPYGSFLPTIWVSSGFSIAVLSFLLTRILLKTRSYVAMWYAASLAITLFASLYEVISAALGVKGFIGNINSVTAALSSSLLASLAIAEQMRQEHQQRLAVQAELEHTYEATPIGLFTLDLNGRFMSANPAMRRMLGPDLLAPGSREWHRYFGNAAWMQLHHMVHSHADGELEIKRDGTEGVDSPKRYLVKATRAHDKIEGSLQDVTEKSRATEDLQFMANNDALTKVLNRRGIEKILNHAMQQLAGGRSLALAYLDLDRFKLINDLYGHNAGDEVLQLVCKRVSDMLSVGMQMGRVGGDEFVIVLPDTRIPLATVICQGIVDSIGATPYQIGDKAFHVRGSIGLIEVAADTRLKDAMSTADRACREAKSGAGGDGLVVYEKNAAAFRQHEAELQLVERLSSSVALDDLFVEMQPIMSLTAPLDSLNFEVLLRMRGPDGKLVPTDRLIAAGESSGHMGQIDRWVLSTTLAWLNTHAARLTRTRFVCMNLSGASVNDEAFTRDVFAMLAQNIHIAGHLCLEITETVALHDLENTRRFIDRVRSYGAKVALDDFGAGYTSFSYLKVLSADLLKIDGSFIVNMNSHPANVAIVEAIVSLARNLGMKTIAEWAEDTATVQTLTEIGVDYVQGYAVARPQLPQEILAATSSASFIKDQELLRLVDLMGQPGADLLQVEMFAPNRPRNVH